MTSTGDPRTIRKELREETLRIVEYARFPRLSAGQRPRLGFTRDISRSGLCVGVDDAEDVGSLLRLAVRDLDGQKATASVQRVVWCTAERDGRYWLGLELLARPEAAQRGPARGTLAGAERSRTGSRTAEA
jgi:hypothetical protein